MPLASQLILMPNGAVAAVQQEVPSAQSPGVHTDTDQVSGNHLTCGWALGLKEWHELGPALLRLCCFSGCFLWFSFFLISVEFRSLTAFELGREVASTETSRVDLEAIFSIWADFLALLLALQGSVLFRKPEFPLMAGSAVSGR